MLRTIASETWSQILSISLELDLGRTLNVRLLTRVALTNGLRGKEKMAGSKSSSACSTVGRHGEGEGGEIESDSGEDGRCKLWENLQQPLYFGQPGPRTPPSTPSTPFNASNDAAHFLLQSLRSQPVSGHYSYTHVLRSQQQANP